MTEGNVHLLSYADDIRICLYRLFKTWSSSACNLVGVCLGGRYAGAQPCPLGNVFGNTVIGRYAVPGGWLRFCLPLPLFVVLYWFFDSYPGVSVNPVAEVRSISLANASAFSLISAMLVLHEGAFVALLFAC